MQDILAESDARMLTELLGDVRDGILITDEAGRIKYVNGAAIHILGLTGNVRGELFDDVCVIYDFVANERIDSPIKQALEEKISVGLRINGQMAALLIFPQQVRQLSERTERSEAVLLCSGI